MAIKLDLKNKIINGCFDFWQRETSFVSPSNTSYLADRWAYGKVGTFTHTITRSADVPSEAFGTYSVLMTVTTAQATLTGTNVAGIQQRIEGNILKTFKNKKVVLSFWVKASKIGTYSIAFLNAATDRSLVKEYTVDVANTWEKKTIRFSHDSAGSWNYDNSLGMYVWFALGIGSSRHGSPDSWQSTELLASTNQVNAVDTIGATFQLTDVVMVEDNEGQTRSPDFMYAGRDYFEELLLCQRYFEKSWYQGYSVGVITNNGCCEAQQISGGWRMVVPFKVVKRAIPTMVSYSPSTGTAGTLRNQDTATDISNSAVRVSDTSATWGNGSGTAAQLHLWHWTADAEL
jgi:hypothetical protein